MERRRKVEKGGEKIEGETVDRNKIGKERRKREEGGIERD